MRTVGHRKQKTITFSASAELLEEGARFNDEMHRLPTGNRTFIPKGLYRFGSHELANHFDFDCFVQGMASKALEIYRTQQRVGASSSENT